MIYDVTIITVRPATQNHALAVLKDSLATAPDRQLLACWTSEIGALNQILILRHFDDQAAALDERRAALESGNPFAIGELVTSMSFDSYVQFPLLDPIASGDFGPVYEVRSYDFRQSGIAPTMDLWRKAMPARAKVSPVIAAMYSVTGAVPRFMHIWPYRSLEERQRLRAKAIADGVWPPAGGPDHFTTQRTDIYLPADFSPMR